MTQLIKLPYIHVAICFKKHEMNSEKVEFISIMIQTYLGFFWGGLGQLTYFSSTELLIVALVGLLKVVLGLTKRISYLSLSILVGSIGEVTMLTITICVVVTIGKLNPSWVALGMRFLHYCVYVKQGGCC